MRLRPTSAPLRRTPKSERAAAMRSEAQRLCVAADEHAWDGAWFRRAFYDDSTPLGSADDDECKIDQCQDRVHQLIAGAGNVW